MIHRYIIEATDEVKGFEEAIERLDREWGIEELEPCDDVISRAYIEPIIEELENICVNGDEHILNLLADIKNAPPVTPQPKCENCQNHNYCDSESEQNDDIENMLERLWNDTVDDRKRD